VLPSTLKIFTMCSATTMGLAPQATSPVELQRLAKHAGYEGLYDPVAQTVTAFKSQAMAPDFIPQQIKDMFEPGVPNSASIAKTRAEPRQGIPDFEGVFSKECGSPQENHRNPPTLIQRARPADALPRASPALGPLCALVYCGG